MTSRAGLRKNVESNIVYVWNQGEYDRSLWLTIVYDGADSCVLQLTDLCRPGKLSQLSSVRCPVRYLKTALQFGALQVTLSDGFLLMRSNQDVTYLEFRSREDTSIARASLKTADLAERLDAINTETAPHALAV